MTRPDSPASLRVLLTDDHPVVRRGLAATVSAFADLEVACEASDGTEALRLLDRERTLGHRIDVVVMDLQMRPMDGVTATREIRGRPDPPPVLILTTYDTDADIVAAVEAGAAGYLLKDAPPETIAEAIRAAAAGETVLAPSVAERLDRAAATALTAREVEIVELLATGASNKTLSRTLFISEATVKTHLIHIFAKLGVDNRTAAVRAARERRIIRG